MEYSKMGISTELFTDSATGTSEGRDTLGVCLNAFSTAFAEKIYSVLVPDVRKPEK